MNKFKLTSGKKILEKMPPLTEGQKKMVREVLSGPYIVRRNLTGDTMTLTLACGCRITLSPGADVTLYELNNGCLVCELHAQEKS